jgi:hypothetical protein
LGKLIAHWKKLVSLEEMQLIGSRKHRLRVYKQAEYAASQEIGRKDTPTRQKDRHACRINR